MPKLWLGYIEAWHSFSNLRGGSRVISPSFTCLRGYKNYKDTHYALTRLRCHSHVRTTRSFITVCMEINMSTYRGATTAMANPRHTSRRTTAMTTTTPTCPTATVTGTVCSTCVFPLCLLLSTITNPDNCPTHIPTVTEDFPCSTAECRLGCRTTYIIATPTT